MDMSMIETTGTSSAQEITHAKCMQEIKCELISTPETGFTEEIVVNDPNMSILKDNVSMEIDHQTVGINNPDHSSDNNFLNHSYKPAYLQGLVRFIEEPVIDNEQEPMFLDDLAVGSLENKLEEDDLLDFKSSGNVSAIETGSCSRDVSISNTEIIASTNKSVEKESVLISNNASNICTISEQIVKKEPSRENSVVGMNNVVSNICTIPQLIAPKEIIKCIECGTQYTMMWRNGPLGPKTLCNICGIRFKSKRLLPELGPDASPTFSSDKNSKDQKAIREVRNEKDSVREQAAQVIPKKESASDHFDCHQEKSQETKRKRSSTPKGCTHCGMQKTPLWRNGPEGPKTLCNACGLRYRSKRLIPELGCVASPTFSSDENSKHREVPKKVRQEKDSMREQAAQVTPKKESASDHFDSHHEKSQENKGKRSSSPKGCTHCGTQKTPMWRNGPEGPNTSCNACGMRYRSGRLFPGYKPTQSPSFLADKHSCSHKMVMVLRSQSKKD